MKLTARLEWSVATDLECSLDAIGIDKEPRVRPLTPLLLVSLLATPLVADSRAVPGSSAVPKNMRTICLVPMPAPNKDEKSLANPTGRNPEADYAVQLDARPAVQVKVFSQLPVTSTKQWIRDYPEGTLLSDLALEARHTIVVRHKGKPIESFRFRISDREPDQCLFMKELYLTWNLWPRAHAPWCKCPGMLH